MNKIDEEKSLENIIVHQLFLPGLSPLPENHQHKLLQATKSESFTVLCGLLMSLKNQELPGYLENEDIRDCEMFNTNCNVIQ